MPNPVRILLFGSDSHLLKTRQLVLQNAGYETYLATSVLALNHIVSAHPINLPIDLLLLCHSLAPEECKRARSIARARFPNIKVLILAVNRLISYSADGDSVVDTAEGPKTLLATVEELVRGRIPPEPLPVRVAALHGSKSWA